MKEGKKPENPEKTPDDELQKMQESEGTNGQINWQVQQKLHMAYSLVELRCLEA